MHTKTFPRIELILLTQCIALFVAISFAETGISPFEYSFIAPTDEDMTQEEAIRIADAYYSNYSDRFLRNSKDISTYEKTCHFIRITRNDAPVYCWAVAYNDGLNMTTLYGFAGIIIISSPDGRILDFCDDDYWQCFNNWETALHSSSISAAEIYAKIDSIALPEDNRTKHIMPDMNVISEREAIQIACRLIASYEHISENDILYDFCITIVLKRDLVVSDYPIWYVTFNRYIDNGTETSDIAWSQYTVAIYAHKGTIWYAIDHVANSLIAANH